MKRDDEKNITNSARDDNNKQQIQQKHHQHCITRILRTKMRIEKNVLQAILTCRCCFFSLQVPFFFFAAPTNKRRIQNPTFIRFRRPPILRGDDDWIDDETKKVGLVSNERFSPLQKLCFLVAFYKIVGSLLEQHEPSKYMQVLGHFCPNHECFNWNGSPLGVLVIIYISTQSLLNSLLMDLFSVLCSTKTWNLQCLSMKNATWEWNSHHRGAVSQNMLIKLVRWLKLLPC